MSGHAASCIIIYPPNVVAFGVPAKVTRSLPEITEE